MEARDTGVMAFLYMVAGQNVATAIFISRTLDQRGRRDHYWSTSEAATRIARLSGKLGRTDLVFMEVIEERPTILFSYILIPVPCLTFRAERHIKPFLKVPLSEKEGGGQNFCGRERKRKGVSPDIGKRGGG